MLVSIARESGKIFNLPLVNVVVGVFMCDFSYGRKQWVLIDGIRMFVRFQNRSYNASSTVVSRTNLDIFIIYIILFYFYYITYIILFYFYYIIYIILFYFIYIYYSLHFVDFSNLKLEYTLHSCAGVELS